MTRLLGCRVECVHGADGDVHAFLEHCPHDQKTLMRVAVDNLESHQVPRIYHHLQQIPHHSHGKVDRLRLKQLTTSLVSIKNTAESPVSLSEVRQLVEEAWTSVLKQSPLSSDRF